MKKTKIFVIGSYGAGNIGDEAILQVITEKFSEKNFEVIPAIPQLPYRFFSIPFRLKTFWNLWKSDLVLIGGGGLFTDSDSIKAIKIWGKNIFWAKLFGKKTILFANSIGPFHQKKSQELTKKYFKKIDYFSVRDEISLKELEKMGYKGEVFSDPVFSFNYKKRDRSQFGETGLKNKIIAVSLRNLNNGKFNFSEFEKFLLEKEKNGYTILFVAMEDSDSVLFEKNFINKKQQASACGRIIFKPKNFSELLEILSDVEFCIGMRLHFLIASAILGKKILAISYSQKVRGIMEKLGVSPRGLSEINSNIDFENFKKPTPGSVENEKEKFSELIDKIKEFLK